MKISSFVAEDKISGKQNTFSAEKFATERNVLALSVFPLVVLDGIEICVVMEELNMSPRQKVFDLNLIYE